MYEDTIKIRLDNFSINLALWTLISIDIGLYPESKLLFKIIDSLKDNKSYRIKETNIDLNEIISCKDKTDIDILLTLNRDCTGKTIFISNYDELWSKELQSFVLSGNNRIILDSHRFYGWPILGADSFTFIQYNRENKEFYTTRLIYLPTDDFLNLKYVDKQWKIIKEQ